jgi:hypothetical protein
MQFYYRVYRKPKTVKVGQEFISDSSTEFFYAHGNIKGSIQHDCNENGPPDLTYCKTYTVQLLSPNFEQRAKCVNRADLKFVSNYMKIIEELPFEKCLEEYYREEHEKPPLHKFLKDVRPSCHPQMFTEEKIVEILQDELSKNNRQIKFNTIPPSLINEDMLDAFLSSSCSAEHILENLHDHFKTEKSYLRLLKHKKDPYILSLIPEIDQSPQMCVEAVSMEAEMYEYIPEKYKTCSYNLEYIKANYKVFKYIPEGMLGYDGYLETIKRLKKDGVFGYTTYKHFVSRIPKIYMKLELLIYLHLV